MDYPKKELAMLSITALTSLYLTNTESVHASETITPAFSLSTTNSISSTLEIPYQIIYHEDASLEKGQEVVIVQGVLGLKDELGRIIKSPINKVVILGTKETKQTIDDANIINPPVNNDPKGKDDTPTSPVNNDPKGKDDTLTSPVNNDPKGKDDTPTSPVNNDPKG
ncbi:G5 domain-containing protein, partial [Aerococcus sanguinicola]